MSGGRCPAVVFLLAFFGWSWPGLADQPRIEADSTQRPWSAVGRVNRTTGGFCTGTLIGPRLVLTAAHCLWNRRTGDWLPATALHFLAGYRSGAYVGHATIERYRLPSGLAMNAKGHPVPRGSDWALLVLTTDLGRVAGTIGIEELAVSKPGAPIRLTLASYSQDKAHLLSRYEECLVAGFSPRSALLMHGCAPRRGSSGSPLLLETAGGVHLVALHVGTTDAGGRGVAVLLPAHEVRALSRPALP